ncbi:hypothetical protein BG011_001413 [Mortierella polycephala]|uniref:Acyl carrier protein n=1 Tax=Mortierella polycephala TaxID=41804 RepID=A0A9P6Q8X0_9FUNG|nr:hypothetical protein BG011_001413 [Mortierella polycephala]
MAYATRIPPRAAAAAVAAVFNCRPAFRPSVIQRTLGAISVVPRQQYRPTNLFFARQQPGNTASFFTCALQSSSAVDSTKTTTNERTTTDRDAILNHLSEMIADRLIQASKGSKESLNSCNLNISPGSLFLEDLHLDDEGIEEMIMEIESVFGVEVTDLQARDLKTLQDVVDFIIEYRKQQQ